MRKYLISLMTLLFLAGVAPKATAKAASALKRENLKEFLSKKKRTVASVFDEDYYESKNGHHVVLLSQKMECGQGTCTSYVFIQGPKGVYSYVGEIDGLVTEITEDKTSGYLVVHTMSRAGQGVFENIIWKLNVKKMRYEAN